MLSINTNISSYIAQRSLNNSTQLLNQAIERMTTGYKLNHAKDNAANYSISTNQTTKLSAYQVAEDNASMGLDFLTTANDSLNLISEHLTRIRDLAIQAGNGTYGEQSLEAINAEVNARLDEIQRLYNTTEYNGVKLLAKDSLYDLTFDELGIGGIYARYNYPENFLGGLIIMPNTRFFPYSVGELVDHLEGLGFSVSIVDGVISLESSFCSDYISGPLADALGMSTTNEDCDFVVRKSDSPVVYNKRELATLDTTFVELGLEAGTVFIVKYEEWESFNGAREYYLGLVDDITIGYLLKDYLSECDFGNVRRYSFYKDVTFKDGVLTYIWDGDHRAFGGTIEQLGIDPYEPISSSTQPLYANKEINIDYDTTIGSLGLEGKHNFEINGESFTLYLDSSTTLSELKDMLKDKKIFFEIRNGNVAFSSKKDFVLSTAFETAFHLDPATIETRNVTKNTPSTKFVDEIKEALEKTNNVPETQLQIGINGSDSSQISINTSLNLNNLSPLRNIGLMDFDYLSQIDNILSTISSKQVEYGACQNRLESALDEISTHYENLASSRSTLRDADIAKVSSEYIRQQILQQASATLMATANQSPSIALQLL